MSLKTLLILGLIYNLKYQIYMHGHLPSLFDVTQVSELANALARPTLFD